LRERGLGGVEEALFTSTRMLFPVFNAVLLLYSKLMLWGNDKWVTTWNGNERSMPSPREEVNCNGSSDEFTLKHVVSGADAYRIGNIQKISGGSPEAFELSTLRLPEAAKNIPGFRLKFGAGKHEEGVIGAASPSFVPKPNDFETIVNFAKMSSDAYLLHGIKGDWKNMTDYTEVHQFYRKNILPKQ
jgi:hypothetical protein